MHSQNDLDIAVLQRDSYFMAILWVLCYTLMLAEDQNKDWFYLSSSLILLLLWERSCKCSNTHQSSLLCFSSFILPKAYKYFYIPIYYFCIHFFIQEFVLTQCPLRRNMINILDHNKPNMIWLPRNKYE